MTPVRTPTLQQRIRMAMAREAARAVYFVAGWAICDGCNNSCTGSYAGHQCCTRCQKVVT